MTKHKRVLLTTSWDDGHSLDLKVADLLDQYGITGTFYIPLQYGRTLNADPLVIRELADRFEVGAHSLTHPNLIFLEEKRLVDEIRRSKMALEDITGKAVSLFSYPYGKYNQRVQRAVIDAGFLGARTTRELSITLDNNLWSIPTTLLIYPQSPTLRIRKAIIGGNWYDVWRFMKIGPWKNWPELAIRFFDISLIAGGIWHIWGHSWQIEEKNMWGDLKKVLERVSHRRNVSYLTNHQVLETASSYKKSLVR